MSPSEPVPFFLSAEDAKRILRWYAESPTTGDVAEEAADDELATALRAEFKDEVPAWA